MAVNNQNYQIKKGLLLNLSVNFLKPVNIWQSYEQEEGCLAHFVRLATTLIKDEESARDNHVLVCFFIDFKYFLSFRDLKQ